MAALLVRRNRPFARIAGSYQATLIEAQACGPPPDHGARPATWQALSSRLRLNELSEYGQVDR